MKKCALRNRIVVWNRSPVLCSRKRIHFPSVADAERGRFSQPPVSVLARSTSRVFRARSARMDTAVDHSKLFAGTVTSTYYNIVLQIWTKLATFLLNGLILRYISKDLLGVVNVRLLLLHTSILFFAREGLRRAASGNVRPAEWKQTVNLVWVSIAFSGLLTILGSVIWIYVLEVPVEPYYATGVVAYALSSLIEMFAEVPSILAQELMHLKIRIGAKGSSMLVQTVLNAIFVICAPQYGVLIFAVSHVIASAVYTAVYFRYFRNYLRRLGRTDPYPVRSMRDFFPCSTVPMLPDNLARLSWSFTKQSFLKQLLTEGERYIMSGIQLMTFAEQGIYDVVNNLGSLVARLFFLQVEENAYVLFSKVLSRDASTVKNQPTGKDAFGAKMLEVYLKSIMAFSLLIAVFGYHYSDIVLSLYGGDTLSTDLAPQLMRAYWFYVLFLAVNGVTEAFVFSAMSKSDVDSYNKKLALFTAAFLFFSVALVKQCGPVGFIYANMLNMGLRIGHSTWFILRYYEGTPCNPLKGMILNIRFIAALLAVCAAVPVFRYAFDLQSLIGILMYLVSGGILGCGLLGVLWKTESELIRFVWNLLRKKPMKTE